MTRTLLATLMLIATGMTVNVAQADHEHQAYRTYDDLAFSAYVSAREFRWEIHDDFTESREYNHLLRDSDTLLEHLRDLQKLVLREESRRTIHHHTDVTLGCLRDIRKCIVTSDYAQGGRRHHVGFRSNPGARFHGDSNPYQVHVDVALGHLAQVEANLNSLCQVLDGRPISPAVVPFNGPIFQGNPPQPGIPIPSPRPGAQQPTPPPQIPAPGLNGPFLNGRPGAINSTQNTPPELNRRFSEISERKEEPNVRSKSGIETRDGAIIFRFGN
ncbi:MAG: hypothetical protein KDA80_11410 [Planctomycetaceae bacterium]|nr:hypothetical protein [Planctomycetaceae bacterium]